MLWFAVQNVSDNSPPRTLRAESKEFSDKKYSDLCELCVLCG
jgi:hypothetical protein